MDNNQIEKFRPFLKWAGGKYNIADKVRKSLPSGTRLIEPFVGAGSIFLNTSFDRYTLNDINKDLINTFKYLKKDKQKFIDYSKQLFIPDNNTKSSFLELRDQFNITDDLRLKSALFIYLNRHVFNGLMRYNQSGKFNTSFGNYKKPYFPDEEMLYFARNLKSAKLTAFDFSKVMQTAKKGDVVYCDPPYVPLSLTAKFTSYHSTGFGLAQQEELVSLARELSAKGIPVVISNHDTEFVQNLYCDAKVHSFKVQRFISSKVDNRKAAKEVLAVFNEEVK